MTEQVYCKRLIEVDLPIRHISSAARREKSIRHGHLSTLHLWWARRPLAACRAVICASLWPDPADELCPQLFATTAKQLMLTIAREHLGKLSEAAYARFNSISKRPKVLDDAFELRGALLDFVGDISRWDVAGEQGLLDIAQALTAAAHTGLTQDGTARPLVIDPFAGGGSIPLEALRVGADAYATDLNPVPVLLNRIALDFARRFGDRLLKHVRECGETISREARARLSDFYPPAADGSQPIAYLAARTITCEGPGCGYEVPLLRTLLLAKKSNRSIGMQLQPDHSGRRIEFRLIRKEGDGWRYHDTGKSLPVTPKFEGTVKKGSATCPNCNYTTPVGRVRQQLKARRGGALDARMFAVVSVHDGVSGRIYRPPTDADLSAVDRAAEALRQFQREGAVPDEQLDIRGIRRVQVPNYGMTTWGDLFTARQAVALCTLNALIADATATIPDSALRRAVAACLALTVSKEADLTNSLTRWKPDAECPVNLFARQAVPIVWEFAEAVAISNSSGSWESMLERTVQSLESLQFQTEATGQASQSSATEHSLPDDSAHALVTDPPYYDAITYSYLSDFFYVWLRRSLRTVLPDVFAAPLVPKDDEIIVDPPHESSNSHKTIEFYERELTRALAEARRVVRPDGVGVIVFASKTTASWEAVLNAVIAAGWTITGSWPIDTEMDTRVAAQGQARLGSSVHLVCRPRETRAGELRLGDVGEWRGVLRELPLRISAWMPRLAAEGVVGADAIFACLGPALEVFSRYSRVEKANGDAVALSEYLEHVWSAVAREALAMVFESVDTTGLEPDGRLTAIWLWTLSGGATSGENEPVLDDVYDDEERAAKKKSSGFVLEFDAARKLAQGLGAHLEDIGSVVEVRGDTARLLSIAERAPFLFTNSDSGSKKTFRAKTAHQESLFTNSEPLIESDGTPEVGAPAAASTTLDRVHQSMILFGAGRGDALKRFLIDEGVGNQPQFWKLAQSLSALYPSGTDEKRWIDGVLARKKSFGFA